MPDKPLVLSAPAPRALPLIFEPEALARLRADYEVVEVEAHAIAGLDAGLLAAARYLIGQPALDAATLERMAALRCVFNVEGNLLPNMPYEAALSRGIHVVTTGAVFAEPVAELGLCLALCLARDVVEADLAFREGRELWGLEGNAGARLISGGEVGILGFGDVGRAVRRLLRGFRARVRVHDPWLPPSLIEEEDAEPAALHAVLSGSDVVFVAAAVTDENQGALGASAFRRMRRGASLVLLSRAEAVDFDALMDAVGEGRIRAASDVFPKEPLPRGHRARSLPGLLRSAHRAGALPGTFHAMGRMVLEDMALMNRGLPPRRCRRAERETALRMRSRPVDRS